MENLRGAAMMTLAMLGFAIEDTLIKLMADALPTWQIILCMGLGGGVMFGALTLVQRQRLWTPAMLTRPVLLRNLGEIIGIVCFVTALARTDLSSASAILQALPLVVTLSAAVFLKESVGWRRWSAIVIGFLGVMLIVRPGMDGFDANALFAVVAVLGLAIRDTATRRVGAGVSSTQLSFLAFMAAVPSAGILAAGSSVGWVAPTPALWGMIVATILMGGVAYFAIVQATRIGEVSYVTPFRYSRIVFALIAGAVVFGERPDALMLLGIAIILGSGLFTLWREGKIAAAA